MKITKKLSRGVIIALIFCASSWSVSALDSAEDLQIKIAALRSTHSELSMQVQAGTITTEEARLEWQSLVEQLRLEKDTFFGKRMEQVQVKYQQFAEKKPERAELIKERIDASLEARSEIKIKQTEVRTQVKEGVIDGKEALQIQKRLLQESMVTLQNVRQQVNVKREARGYIKLGDMKGETLEHTLIKIGDISNGLNVKTHAEATESRVGARENDSLGNEQEPEAIRNIGFDPIGLKALESFPDIKADISAAVDARNNKVRLFLDN